MHSINKIKSLRNEKVKWSNKAKNYTFCPPSSEAAAWLRGATAKRAPRSELGLMQKPVELQWLKKVLTRTNLHGEGKNPRYGTRKLSMMVVIDSSLDMEAAMWGGTERRRNDYRYFCATLCWRTWWRDSKQEGSVPLQKGKVRKIESRLRNRHVCRLSDLFKRVTLISCITFLV